MNVEGDTEREILKKNKPRNVHWKAFENTKLFNDGIDPNDIHQGKIGDCYLLAALSSVAIFPGYVEKMLCHGQRNNQQQYCIKWYAKNNKVQCETWVTPSFVVNNGDESFYHASSGKDEIWVNIIEKGYAIRYGGYDKIGNGGQVAQALEDLTGSDVNSTKIKYFNNSDNWKRITDGCEDISKSKTSGQGHIMCAGIYWSPFVRYITFGFDRQFMYYMHPCLKFLGLTNFFWPCWLWIIYFFYYLYSLIDAYITCGIMNTVINTIPSTYCVGLVSGHAYSVIGYKTHKVCGFFEIKLVKVRNPWGNGIEFKGAWSDRSWYWYLFPKLKEEINSTPSNDGSFWMGFNDFLLYFDTIDSCTVDLGNA